MFLKKNKNQKYCYVCNEYYNTFVCKTCQSRTISTLKNISAVSEMVQMVVSRNKHIKNVMTLINILTNVKVKISLHLIMSILLIILI